ncbi:MAG: hypothetical protein ABEH66_06345 [Halobacteriales archaeon]
MSGDVSDMGLSEFPEPVSEWLAQMADEQDLSEEELLARLFGGSTDGEGPDPSTVADRLDDVQSSLDGLESLVEGLEADTREEIEDLEEDTQAKIEDVRERVIQVKRDADAKADPDHDHPDLDDEIANLDDDVAVLFQDLDDLEERFEDSMEELTTETAELREAVEAVPEDVSEKLTMLAVAVVETRDQVRELLAERQERAHAAELRTDANRNGVRAATCENCENGVDLALLTSPRCPHCSEVFEELDPKDGFFGTNYLRTGRPPALEPGDMESEASDLEEMIESEE